MRTNILKYESNRPEFPNIIVPTKQTMPQWYKDAEVWVDGKIGPKNHGLKSCVPFLDALVIGYTMVTTDDILVSVDDLGQVSLTWREGNTILVIDRDPKAARTIPIPAGCHPDHLAWRLQGTVEIPKGYSAIFTHPFNRSDLPFVTLTGVVDDHVTSAGNIPFFIKKDFTGIIPQGTPFLQIIPLKQEHWKTKNSKGLLKKSTINNMKTVSVFKGWYKNNVWKKKHYD